MTDTRQLESTINAAWEIRDTLSSSTRGEKRDAVIAAIEGLDEGALRVAEKIDGEWRVNEWLKKAVLMSFRLGDSVAVPGGPRDPEQGDWPWVDKEPPKFEGWGENRIKQAGCRAVPTGESGRAA